jgi:hypothetical protein
VDENGRCGNKETISSRVSKLCSPWTRTFRVVSRVLNAQRVGGIMVVSDKTAEQEAPTMPLRSRRGATSVQGGFSADYETSTSTEVLSAFFGVPFIDTVRQTLLSVWISTKKVRRTAEPLLLLVRRHGWCSRAEPALRAYCCPPLLPSPYLLQWFRAQIYHLSLSTRGSILFARFELCGPDVVALPRAPSRAR